MQLPRYFERLSVLLCGCRSALSGCQGVAMQLLRYFECLLVCGFAVVYCVMVVARVLLQYAVAEVL